VQPQWWCASRSRWTSKAHRRAKHRAAELGISFAEHVRRALDRDLGEPPRRIEPSQVFGLIDSGGADVAREKDSYVDQAVAASRQA
jgi:hypothetical protein